MKRCVILKLTVGAFIWSLVPKKAWAIINLENQPDQRLVQTDALRICGYAGMDQNGRRLQRSRASRGCNRPFLISWFSLPWAFNPDWVWNGKVFRFSPERDGHCIEAYWDRTKRRFDSDVKDTDQSLAEQVEKEKRYLASVPLICPHCGHSDVDLLFVRGTP